MVEIWRDIAGYEGLYQVSNEGRVRSLTRLITTKRGVVKRKKGALMKQCLSSGYPRVALWIENIKTDIRVHALVAGAFIPNPENKACVNHINAVKTDNRVKNLEWATIKENNNHAYKMGLHGDMHKRCKKSANTRKEKGLYDMRQVLNVETGIYYDSIKDARDAHGLSHNIYKMLAGQVSNRSSFVLT